MTDYHCRPEEVGSIIFFRPGHYWIFGWLQLLPVISCQDASDTIRADSEASSSAVMSIPSSDQGLANTNDCTFANLPDEGSIIYSARGIYVHVQSMPTDAILMPP
ncbi:unnamed protein product [Protopolystoma xenopodis]|uniref:Uncharacterized protein n=1 Tax=Protopolystoma xenopodis TaxID=117903 RepID=A0A3S5A4J1_9PLAT|nr:unnamed protein product [Protopolystoma xenopodis]